MVDFLRKRLQVFVSSTFSDLIAERQAAVEAILSAGHIPAGMELFTAGDESQMDVIKQWINESDVYMLILGGRYGSVEPKSEKSYTQLEYEYALSLKKPLFACVVKKEAHERRVKEFGTRVVEAERPQQLRTFREDVMTRMVKFWEDAKDIKIVVGETLSLFARRDELIGWVRPSQSADVPALADEIARLSKENASLRFETSHNALPGGQSAIDFEHILKLLKEKYLLDFLLSERGDLLASDGGARPSLANRNRYAQLILLGLVARTYKFMSDVPYFVLSDAGMAFLTWLELGDSPTCPADH
jgi:Domain of unknown function (DUF4062)